MSAQVAQRFLIAQRVADRVAASMGDPHQLLAEYSEALTEFSQVEDSARNLRDKYEEIFVAKNHMTPTTEADVQQLKALRSEIPDHGDGSPVRIRVMLSKYGFDALKIPARSFCLAVIQQLVLPPRLRKSIEAAAKFWTKSARKYRLKARISSPEEWSAEHIDIYFSELELFRKYEKLFEQILDQGKEHTTEGEGATTIQAGPFTVVNGGGFDAATMAAKVKLVEDCARRMQYIGLGKACYGNVLITNRLNANAHTQAFYTIASDELFIRGDAKVTMDGVHAVCHELAHRYHYKFLGSSNPEVSKIYTTLKYSRPSLTDLPRPEKGESLTWKGKTYVVDSIDWMRERIKMRDPEEPDTRVAYFLPLSAYPQAKGLPPPKQAFVTAYAEKGGPGENFAEMVAFHAMGKLPDEQLELLKPLL